MLTSIIFDRAWLHVLASWTAEKRNGHSLPAFPKPGSAVRTVEYGRLGMSVEGSGRYMYGLYLIKSKATYDGDER